MLHRLCAGASICQSSLLHSISVLWASDSSGLRLRVFLVCGDVIRLILCGAAGFTMADARRGVVDEVGGPLWVSFTLGTVIVVFPVQLSECVHG